MPYKKDVTIQDVADAVGVSTATVSRALNYPQKVGTATYQKIIDAIEELHFVPSSVSARIRNPVKEDRLVFLLVPNIFNEAIVSIIDGASDYLTENGVHSVIWNSNESALQEDIIRQYISVHPAQGGIAIYSVVEDHPCSLIAEKMPFTTVECYLDEPNIDSIRIDNDQAMSVLVGHLVELGHRNIGFMCGDISSSNSIKKVSAYKKALAHFNINWDATRIFSTGWHLQDGITGVKKMLECSPELSALICITDMLAIGAINGVREMGLNCPENISITGLDHATTFAELPPSLTTLDYPGYQMGRAAAQRILNRMENRRIPKSDQLFSVSLIRGETTGPCKQR